MAALPLRKKLLFSLIIFTLVSVVLFGIGELAARAVGYGNYILFEPNDRLLFVPKPDQHGVTVAGRRPININSQGLRYGRALVNPSPSLRVLTFGDSVTMGWAMSDDEHYSARLEQRLQEQLQDDRIEVVSAGVNAYPLSLCVERIAQLAEDGIDFDVAVLAYSFNSLHEDLAALRGEDRNRFLKKVRLKNLVRRSALYNLVIEDWLREAVYYRIRERIIAGSWEVAKDDTEAETGGGATDGALGWKGQLERTRAALERAEEVTSQHGIRLVLLLLGSQGQGDDELLEYQEEFRRFAASRLIPLIDMPKVLTGQDPELMFVDQVHPSALGHQRIADELASVIKEAVTPAVPRGNEEWLEGRDAQGSKR